MGTRHRRSEIYIQLLNEGTIVYRPTEGEEIGDLIYKVLPTKDYDLKDEEWEFPPGKIVRCIKRVFDNKEVLVAQEEVS